MTKEQLIQQTKNEALNTIRKICHKDYNGCNEWDESSCLEQKMYRVDYIIEQLEKELLIINKKYKEGEGL